MSGERNSKLTDARVEAILNALRTGCTRRAAAAVGGISHTTLYDWMNNDPTLAATIERAEGEAEATFTAIVARAAPTSWQASAWWLERRKYQDYGRRDKVEMSIDLRKEAERIAAEMGLDPAEVLAEAEAIMRGAK
uniref:Putative DNA binding, helix-turn-helix domain containing protein n=1 Tax=viral metagenome TaxID=1070528 RepID=A0A6M3JKW8_9ZZZZ